MKYSGHVISFILFLPLLGFYSHTHDEANIQWCICLIQASVKAEQLFKEQGLNVNKVHPLSFLYPLLYSLDTFINLQDFISECIKPRHCNPSKHLNWAISIIWISTVIRFCVCVCTMTSENGLAISDWEQNIQNMLTACRRKCNYQTTVSIIILQLSWSTWPSVESETLFWRVMVWKPECSSKHKWSISKCERCPSYGAKTTLETNSVVIFFILPHGEWKLLTEPDCNITRAERIFSVLLHLWANPLEGFSFKMYFSAQTHVGDIDPATIPELSRSEP